MMYADWCPHCSNPETRGMWGKLGNMMDKDSGYVAAFNCADEENGNKSLASKLNIRGYPTVLTVLPSGQLSR
jgi:hypothetical protein